MARTRSSYYFPQELIFEILSYLPVVSLLRFRSVCKSWRTIISNQQFINTHLTNSQKKQATLALLDGDLDHVYIDTCEESVRLKVPPRCKGLVRLISSCNGLVCLADEYNEDIYLWNPSIRQLKKLPTPRGRGPWVGTNFGFVFDSISNDYKVLRITLCLLHDDPTADDMFYVLEADLYSSNAGYWKEISVPKTVPDIVVCSNWKSINDLKTGVLYLEGIDELLSFDLHNEVFGVFPFPDSVQHSKSNVMDFEGSASMIFESIGDGSVLSLWTLDKVCDDKVSWTKKFNIEADLKIDWVILYLGDGKFVAKNDAVGHTFYDYKKKDTKKFLSPAPCAPSDELFNSVVKYTESLVSLEDWESLVSLEDWDY